MSETVQSIQERAEQMVTATPPVTSTCCAFTTREAVVALVAAALAEGAIRGQDGEPLPVEPGVPPKKGPKNPSRPQRWAQAVSEAQQAISEATAAVERLKEVQEEYGEWKDNLPENLQQGALADKLEEVTNIDLEGALSSLEEADSAVGEADGADLPQGFGRD